MTVDDALAKLTAGLDEDERIAQEAIEVLGPAAWNHALSEDYSGMYNSAIESADDRFARVDYEQPADHIARQDPAATLRRVEAIRKVIAAHKRDDWYELPDGTTGSCEECSSYCDEVGCRMAVAWPCPTLRALAGIYTEDTIEQEGSAS